MTDEKNAESPKAEPPKGATHIEPPAQASSTPEPAKELSSAENPTKRQKFWAFAFAATGFLIVYLLSAGPMAAIHKASRFGPFQRALGIVYAPVIFDVEQDIEPFASPMKAYIKIFR